ncbi:hypothetical protein LTR95_008278 [Oleoguttula sp. CCFEE 5521]
MELSHYETQRARTHVAAPVDLRALEYVSPYNENLVCPICRCPFVDPVLLSNCDHCFCRDCIRQTWATNTTAHTPSETRGSCPSCRAPAQMGPRSATSKLIVNILDELVVECPTSECDAKVRRGEVQDHRMEEHEVAQRQLTRKLEVLQDGFATMQTILDTRPSNPDDDSADETRIPFLPGHSRGASVATIGTAISPEDYDFPQPPSRNSEDSATTTSRSMHTANMSPPRRAPPVPPGTLRRDLLEPFSSDFDLAEPFPPLAAADPYASPLHHLLSMHESLREEMSRMATTMQELDGRHSMQMLNENIRSRDEVAHLGAQVAAIGRQVHWLTSTQLQRTQTRGSGTQEGGAGPSNQYEDASAGAGIEAAVNAVSTAATALRGAARMVNVGRDGDQVMRRRTSEEGRTKL